MAEELKATETTVEPIAPQPVTVSVEDHEAKIEALEAEKAQVETERNNYRSAYLKEKGKGSDSDEDEKMRQIALQTLAESRLGQIAIEQDGLIKKIVKENKELKLAVANKADAPLSTTSSSAPTTTVKDTLITPDQLASFKAKGWSDKDIARYKQNLLRNTR